MSNMPIDMQGAMLAARTRNIQTPVAAANDDERAARAAEQFESMFIMQMVREMRKSVREISPEGSIFRDETTAGMFDYMDMMVADQLASQRAFGIADFILAQIAPEAASRRAGTTSDSTHGTTDTGA
jgi:Rod binding domain-containing protein